MGLLVVGAVCLLVAGMLATGIITAPDGTACGSLASPSDAAACVQPWKLRLGLAVTAIVVGAVAVVNGVIRLDP